MTKLLTTNTVPQSDRLADLHHLTPLSANLSTRYSTAQKYKENNKNISVSACSAERLTCADQCLERTLAARRQRLTEERSASEQLAILASRAGLPSLTVSLQLVTSLAISFTSL